MSVGNIRNTNDLINKKREYAEYLQLMIDNESIKEKRIKDYKNPNKAPPVPPQYKTASERTKDLYEQEKTAIDNVKELGVDISEARSFVLQLEQKQDGIDNLVKLNRNFPAFKKLMTENYKTKDFEANLLLNAWEGFSVNLNALTGLNSVSSGATSAFSSASDNYMKLPTQDELMEFKKNSNDVLFTNANLSISDTLKASVAISIDNAIRLTLDDSTVAKINDAITPIEKSQINKLAEQLLSVYKIPTKDEIEKKIDAIKTFYETLTEDNSVSVNDLITKELVILNRYLSVFSDETTSKRLTAYNEFVSKLISDFTSEVREEFKKTTPEKVETPEFDPTGRAEPQKSSNKVDLVKFIMTNKLYNEAKYDKLGVKTLYFSKIKLDKYNKNLQSEEEIREIVSNYPAVQLKSILRQIKNKEQRRGTYNKEEANMMGEEDILGRKIRGDEKKKIYEEEKKKIFLEILENYYDIQPTVAEIKLLIKTIVSKFVNTIEDDEDRERILNYYKPIYNSDDINILLNGAVNSFVIGEDVEKYLRNYIPKLINMRGKAEKTKPSALTYKPDTQPDTKPQIIGKPEINNPAESLYGLKLASKIYEDIFNNSRVLIKDSPLDELRKTDLLGLMKSAYDDSEITIEELFELLDKISEILPFVKTYLNREYNKYNKPVEKKKSEPSVRTDESIGLQQANEYVMEKLSSFDYQDYYDRFKALKNEYSDYKRHLSTATGGEYKNAKTFSQQDKNTLDKLRKTVMRNEFLSENEKDIIKNIKKSIDVDNYNPSLERFQKVPKQGLGMKKKKGGDLIHIDIGSHIGKNYKEASGKGFNNKNWVDKAKKDYQANGDQPYIKSRIKIGSGVVVDDEPRYQEFGKYVIHIPQLRKNILNIKYRSGSRPQYLPIVNIDDDTKDLIMTTLDTGKMSENQFNKLPEPIKDHLIKAIKGAGLETKFFKNKDKIYPTDEKEERDRFNLLKGEFDAGNDNPNLIKELRALVIKFIDTRIIPKKQGLEFLRQLN